MCETDYLSATRAQYCCVSHFKFRGSGSEFETRNRKPPYETRTTSDGLGTALVPSSRQFNISLGRLIEKGSHGFTDTCVSVNRHTYSSLTHHLRAKGFR